MTGTLPLTRVMHAWEYLHCCCFWLDLLGVLARNNDRFLKSPLHISYTDSKHYYEGNTMFLTQKTLFTLLVTLISCPLFGTKEFAALTDTDQRVAALKQLSTQERKEAIDALTEPQRIALLQALDAKKRKHLRVNRDRLKKTAEELEIRRQQLSTSKNSAGALKELDELIEENKENIDNLNDQERDITLREDIELGRAAK